MGLMTGTGPLSPRPAGRLNFEPPPPGFALYLEPKTTRIRVVVGGETIADSRRAMLLHEGGAQPTYYFPPEDVRADVLVATDHHTHCPKKGDASYHTIRVGEREIENGAWYYPSPLPGAPPIAGLIAFYFDRVDRWLEEDEEIFGHPRDPYHRIDTRLTSAHIRVSLDGVELASTRNAVALFESNLPPRWYLPLADVHAPLEPSDTVTLCPYKGTAGYWSVRLPGGELVEDLLWYYEEPLPEAAMVAGLVCFYNERVDLELDGVVQERPESPWSHAARR